MKTQTKKLICLLVAIASVLTIVSAVSYAYFTAMADIQEQSATLTTGTMNATFADGNAGISAVLKFGESVTKTFTIQNTGTLESTVQMFWNELTNTYTNGSLTYTLSQSATEDGTYTNIVSDRNVPYSKNPSKNILAYDLTVPANTTYYYRLVIKLNYLENVNQDADVTAKFNSKFILDNQKMSAIDSIIATSKGSRTSFDVAATTDEGIYEMADDYGTSYYYRGAVENNYVKFADKFWRIIRINGDGSLRMIYDGTRAYPNANGGDGTGGADRFIKIDQVWNVNYDDNKYVGWMFGGNDGEASTSIEQAQTNTTNSDIKDVVDDWYKTNIDDKNLGQYISDEIFCNDRSISSTPKEWWSEEGTTNRGFGSTVTVYGGWNRSLTIAEGGATNSKPQFTCPQKNDAFTVKDTVKGNGSLEYPIGLITVDEMIAAGSGKYQIANKKYYLYKNSDYRYWSFTPWAMYTGGYAAIFDITTDGLIHNRATRDGNTEAVAPVINISSEYARTLIGNGTMSSPYQIPGVQ